MNSLFVHFIYYLFPRVFFIALYSLLTSSNLQAASSSGEIRNFFSCFQLKKREKNARFIRQLGQEHALIIAVSQGPLSLFPHLHWDSSRNSSKTGAGVIGHAWALLLMKQELIWHGGHSGEKNQGQVRYLDGFVRLANWGTLCKDPPPAPWKPHPNPIEYLFHWRKDGFFQEGSGGHLPDSVVMIPLSLEEAQKVHEAFTCYDFGSYQLFHHQCCHFIQALLKAAGHLSSDISFSCHLPSEFFVQGERITLWSNPEYSKMNLLCPEVLMKELQGFCSCDRATDITSLYRRIFSGKKFFQKNLLRRPALRKLNIAVVDRVRSELGGNTHSM